MSLVAEPPIPMASLTSQPPGKIQNLSQLDPYVLLKIFCETESPAALQSGLGLVCKSFLSALSNSEVCEALARKFYRIKSDTNSQLLSSWEEEYLLLNHKLYPYFQDSTTLVDTSCTLFSAEAVYYTNPVETLKSADEPLSLQSVVPLQPLPCGNGRMKYMEVTLSYLEEFEPQSQFRMGLAWSKCSAENLGQFYSSCSFDLLKRRVYTGSSLENHVEVDSIAMGDTIGIGICFESHSEFTEKECFFVTFNGRVLGHYGCIPASKHGFMFPTFYIHDIKCNMELNTGKKEFKFDLKKWAEKHSSNHALYQLYLPVGPRLFNIDNSVEFWNLDRMAEFYWLSMHYPPIENQLSKFLDAQNVLKLADLHAQVTEINTCISKLISLRYGQYDENKRRDHQTSEFWLNLATSLNFQPDFISNFHWGFKSLPDTSSSSNAIENGYSNNTEAIDGQEYGSGSDNENTEFEAPESSLYSPTPTRASLNKSPRMTRKAYIELHRLFLIEAAQTNWKAHLKILKIETSRLENLPSIYVDTSHFRSGPTEGWMKLAIFLENHKTELEGWPQEVREHTLDFILEMGVDMDSTIPGILSSPFVTQDEVNELPGNADEELKAAELIKYTAGTLAWIGWNSEFRANLRMELDVMNGLPVPSISTAEDDLLLLLFSAGLACEGADVSPAWILMQFRRGFALNSPLNEIPGTLEEALQAVKTFFIQALSYYNASNNASEGTGNLSLKNQVGSVLKDINSLKRIEKAIPEGLEYLYHVYHLALGEASGGDEEDVGFDFRVVSKHIVHLIESQLRHLQVDPQEVYNLEEYTIHGAEKVEETTERRLLDSEKSAAVVNSKPLPSPPSSQIEASNVSRKTKKPSQKKNEQTEKNERSSTTILIATAAGFSLIGVLIGALGVGYFLSRSNARKR